jgi:gliding motility-associatede transport system auxiliary component
MNRIWTIARREVKALFDQPTGYVLLVVFLAINAFMFFRNAYLSNTASLRPMLDLLPWVFLFFVPAVAMRSLAEDNRAGLLEIVLSQPVSEAELLIGKYIGVVLVLALALATTLLVPIGIALGSDLPWGPVVAQYIGALLLAAGFAAVGVWASSLSQSQITAFILGVAIMFLLILVGLDPLLVGLPPAIGAAAARLGVLSHFEAIGRGVLDLRDVLYFLSLAAIFLSLAYGVLLRRRLSPGSPSAGRLRLGLLLLIAVLAVVNLAGGQIRGRLDLTPGSSYTLSKATRDVVGSLDDLVTIKVFATANPPSDFALTKRDLDDLLRDLRAAGHGKVRVVEKDPADDKTAEEDARNLGIVPVQFNVVGQSQLQVSQGYLGLVVQHADKHETIPFVDRTDNLEYRLVTMIRGLSRTTKPKVAMVTDPQAGSFGQLRDALEKSYVVQNPVLGDSTPLSADLSVLVLATVSDSSTPNEVAKVKDYLARGGKALVMESGMEISPQAPIATTRNVKWNPALAPWGISVAQDLVYDLRANQMIGVPTSFGRLLRPYPYFLRAQSTKQSTINSDLTELGLAWTSSIDTTAGKGVQPLFVTTDAGGVSTGTASIDPSTDPPDSNLGPRIVAAQVAPPPDSASGGKAPRLVVVGNAIFATDQFIQRSPENLVFALNAVDWLAQDEALISIRAKDRRPPPLVFTSNGLRDGVKYANVAGLPILIAVFGMVRLVRRRRRAQEPYAPLAGSKEAA